jgi:uncharacterized protein YbjT (DUF2867 family)
MGTGITLGTETVLVLGGTGKTGRRAAARLTERGVPVRVGSRSVEPPFDWEDRSSWAPVLRDVEAVYVTYQPDISALGAAEAIGSFADLAVQTGVRRLVLLSGRGDEESRRAERAVQESGGEWTIMRCGWFSQNFSESFLLQPVLDGELAVPAGETPEPFVDADDIADVAVAALTEEGHSGEVYELTGPRLLTFGQAVGEISKAAGREIRYVPITVEEYASMLKQRDVPPEFARLLIYLFTEILDGRNAHLSDGVWRALGREPRDFADYAWETAADGAWNGAACKLQGSLG